MEGFKLATIERFTNSEQSYSHLKSLLKKLSANINTEMRERFETPKLVDQSGCLSMDHFIKGDENQGAPFDQEEVKRDKERILNQIKEWSGWNDLEKRKNRAVFYRVKEDDEGAYLNAYKKERAMKKSNQLEMALTILFHKALGSKYVVVRASEFDDYFNGVDNVLVNRKTGDVICAFDDFRKSERDKERANEKEEKVLKKLRNGGSTLKYGFTIKDGKVVKGTINNIPIFCLEMKEEDYDELVNNIENTDGNLNDAEIRVFDSLIESIREQKTEFENDKDISKQALLMNNLRKVTRLFGN